MDGLLRSPLGARFRQIEAGAEPLTLEEVPQALDALLDLDASQLRQLLQALGFDVLQLRHADGSRVRRITADLVVQLMGRRDNLGAPLPTTVEAVDRRLDAFEPGEGSSRERNSLLGLRRALEQVPRTTGWGEMGFLALAGWDVGHANPIEERGNIGRYLGGSLLGHSFGLAAGITLSEKNRHTGRRTFAPTASTTARSGLLTGGYSWEPGNGGIGFSFTPANAAIGYNPFAGRHIFLNLPMVVSLCIGERYLAVGWSAKRWSREVGHGYRTGPSFIVGLRGDPVQHLTGPVIRWCFRYADRWKPRLRRLPSGGEERLSRHPSRDDLSSGHRRGQAGHDRAG